MHYRFHIDDSFTPETIPMDRFGTYVRALAQMLGEPASVHFERVSQGSVVLHARVDTPAAPKVRERLAGIHDGAPQGDAARAYAALDDMLRKDNAIGRLEGENDAVVIPFPGRTRPEPIVFGPFKQDGTIDGQVIRIGGRDETIPVNLRDGDIVHTHLDAGIHVAKRLVEYFLGPTVRVHGTGAWLRHADGAWELKHFKITDFEVLDEAPLTDVVARLRAVPGSGWSKVPDPVRELLEVRSDGSQQN